MKSITNIIYQTTREINNVEDKLRIVALFFVSLLIWMFL